MSTAIVPEDLRLDFDNYDNWSACMRNYLLSHDLWDIMEAPIGTEPPPTNQAAAPDHEAENKARRKKNATALYAILTSCTPDMFPLIRGIDSAKTAWDTLFNDNLSRKSLLQSASQAMMILYVDYAKYADLVKYVNGGDWHSTKRFLDQNPEVINAKISSYDSTALHMATRAGKVEIVKMLVELMSLEALAIQDCNGNTALHVAALKGITKMARYMVEKNEETRLRLVAIVNKRGFLPLTSACGTAHRNAAVYLFSNTPFELLSIKYQDSAHGSVFLQLAISSKMLDLALETLHRCPSLATTCDNVHDSTALWSLAAVPDLFPSGCQLGFWKQWIYSCIHVRPRVLGYGVDAHILNQSQGESKNIMQQVLGKLRRICINFLKFIGIKQIYDLKMTHAYSSILLRRMCEQVSRLDESTCDKIIFPAFSKAIELGLIEFIVAMAKVYPEILYTNDANGRTPMMLSIVNRQEKVFSLFCYYGLDAYASDKYENTILAAMLSPSYPLTQISGAALQMQRELQWYKKVESIYPFPDAKLILNKYGETPAQLFTKNHKQLVVEGEKWMKATATSSTVVGALIITIMFTAAFTLPGGNVQDVGIPIFLHKKAFKTFIISDAISLFSSSTSVVMFLGILTSRYGEQDFLISLPRKLIIGLSTLFISIAAMMVAFCAALIVMLDGTMELIIPIVSLACVPVTLFMFLQFPLLVEIFMSTYRPSIFKNSTEN